MSESESEINENFLQKKRKKDSDGRQIFLYEINGEKEILKEEKTFKTITDFSSYISSLKNPYTIVNGEIFDLNTTKNIKEFFYLKDPNKIYENEEDSSIYEDYKYYYQEFETVKDEHIPVTYPIILKKLIIGNNFYINIPETDCPKLYTVNNGDHFLLLSFFLNNKVNLFHLYIPQKVGSTLYFMKQMSRRNEYFLYFDVRKLKHIILLSEKNKNEFLKQIKKFIFYSLFNAKSVYFNISKGFKRIEKYFSFIWSNIFKTSPTNNNHNFIKSMFDAYVELYKNYLLPMIKKEKEESYQCLIFIIDHYKYEIDIDYIKQKLYENQNYLKFLVKHSLDERKEIEEFFGYQDDKNYNVKTLISKGLELKRKQQIGQNVITTMIGYYERMYEFGEKNFGDIQVLSFYKDELLYNFGLYNPMYIFKFIEYMKDKNKAQKNSSLFLKFLKIISTEIELDIRKFYNNDLTDEYFFISKYCDAVSEKKDELDKNKVAFIKKNIPLNYFIIEFKNKSRDISNIIPSFNLVKEIIRKKSQNFASIVYQSNYYDTTDNKGEQGNILQRAVEEKIKIEPSVLLNFSDETVVIEIEHIIPSATMLGSQKFDPVSEFYKVIRGGRKKNIDIDISKYMSESEIKDMEKITNVVLNENKHYKNIILIEKDPKAKHYDMGIIQFIDKSFIMLLFQITVSHDKNKFGDVNKTLEQDILYITSKIEKFLRGYKSAGVYLFYVLDIDESKQSFPGTEKKQSQIEQKKSPYDKIDYKYCLAKELKNSVHLIYFGRKYLNFYTEEGKSIKELANNNNKLEIVTSNINHYFLDENIQKSFEKVLELFKLKIGKVYIENYEYKDVIGNCLIITKINNSQLTVVINIKGKKIHILEINDKIIEEVTQEKIYDSRVSYFFEIKNADEISPISLFSKIII